LQFQVGQQNRVLRLEMVRDVVILDILVTRVIVGLGEEVFIFIQISGQMEFNLVAVIV